MLHSLQTMAVYAVFVIGCMAFDCGAKEFCPEVLDEPQPKPKQQGLKLGDRVGIVCDHSMVEQANALRATLEAWQLRVDLHRLVQHWQAEQFFQKQMAEYDYVIICCHGTDRPKLRIKFEVIVPKKENPELGDMVDFELTPENISTKLNGFRGVLVSMACESGSEPLGKAFLKAGCKAYLAPGDYSDDSSGMMFVMSFFYFLQYQWRLPDPQVWSIKDAADAARKLDPRAKFGTKLWQLYE